MLFAALHSTILDQIESGDIQNLLGQLVLPALQRVDDDTVRKHALLSLACFCWKNKDFCIKYMQFLCQAVKHGSEDLQESMLSWIFDLWILHGDSIFQAVYIDIENSIIDPNANDEITLANIQKAKNFLFNFFFSENQVFFLLII